MKKTLILFLIFILTAGNSTGNIQESLPDGTSIKIGAIGDLVMHIPVKICAKMNNITDGNQGSINNNGFDYLFEPSAYIFKQHDTVIANMEFPIIKPYYSRAFIFNCEPEILPALKKAGINIVTIANNHIYDHGRKGLKETLKVLKSTGTMFVGAGLNREQASKGIIISKKDLKIGILGYTSIFNNQLNRSNPLLPYVNDFIDEFKTLNDIKRLKKQVDFLILNVHWGNEYVTTPLQNDIILARKYVDAGVDMIIGHHPHVLQYVEKVKSIDGRTCFIAYSLGNYISNQAYSYTPSHPLSKGRERDGIILSFQLDKKQKFGLFKEEDKGYTTYLKNVYLIPTWTVNERINNSGKFKLDIRTFPVYDLIKRIDKSLNENIAKKERLVEYRKMLLSRLKETERILFAAGTPEGVKLYKNGISE